MGKVNFRNFGIRNRVPLHAIMADLLKQHLKNVEVQFMSKGIRHYPLQTYFILKKIRKIVVVVGHIYTPVFRRDVLWYSDVRPSGSPSVRPSDSLSGSPSALFSTFLIHALTY